MISLLFLIKVGGGGVGLTEAMVDRYQGSSSSPEMNLNMGVTEPLIRDEAGV